MSTHTTWMVASAAFAAPVSSARRRTAPIGAVAATYAVADQAVFVTFAHALTILEPAAMEC